MTDSIKQKILGLHLSPRAGGTSAVLLDEFAKGVREAGGQMDILSVSSYPVAGCSECGACEEDGLCSITDNMDIFYKAWEEALSIVVSTSLFFYDIPAQGKAVIDRSQAMWSRIYKRGEVKKRPGTKGFLLAVGATKGKDLFIPVQLAVKYFFDALGFPKEFSSLVFRQRENPADFLLEDLAAVKKAGFDFAGGQS